jgi:hypothetical protein
MLGGANMTDFMKDLILSGGKTILMMGILCSLLLAIGYLFTTDMLMGISKTLNRMFNIDDWMIIHRVAAGIVFILITLMLAYVLYSVK